MEFIFLSDIRLPLNLYFQTDGTVVASHDLIINYCLGNIRGYPFACYKIVYAPPRVMLPCFEHIAPPCISVFFIGMQITEAV